ncbi:Transglutaminase family protein [Rhodovastum atsumiense]|uniref:Transglutaminase family protein n=1 Tax=Rhodovastum atsumiense TaxID=504468 RepID=A0A5M6IUC5_9PROT|nr:transglutaminase family protein [Rhodovastum atsumiense]KAA5611926.1 transglutaminase family protein [Rhodovastum atsumiense]CAH2598690.1 Transglutaminase family protein [Rhodovastum atsumiense]
MLPVPSQADALPSVLTVRHVTTYRYASPVRPGEHRMMLRPRESHDLRLIRARLTISPQPAQLRWVHDVFDNSVAVATFNDQATELAFDSEVRLEHTEVPLPEYTLDAAAQHFPFTYPCDDMPDLLRALHRRHPEPDLDLWVKAFLPRSGRTGTMALLRTITAEIRETFRYSRRLERGVQAPTETLSRRSGTCRDFALLMMEAVRTIGLAARFVSGYIFVPGFEPDPILGGGATHAWLQVYLPGAGWVDFDPTNSIVGNRNLIRVAVAWDPAQALPLWGSYFGFGSAFLGMDVSVCVREERQR